MVGLLEPKIRGLVRKSLDAIAEMNQCDFVREVAVPLPLFIIAEMMGIPESNYEQFHKWSDKLIGVQGAGGDPAIFEASLKAYAEYGAYLKTIFEDRRRNPREDLVSILVGAQEDGVMDEGEECMGDDELVIFMTLLLVAGNETTRNGISGGMEALMANPSQRKLLIEKPELIESATEEVLRYVSPILSFRRTATQDTEILGQPIKKGDGVVMLYASANRDEAVFENPDLFDITREPNPHVAFGIGNHFCLGANLARMEIRVMIHEILKRFPDMQLSPGSTPVRSASTLIRGIQEMHVLYSAAYGLLGGATRKKMTPT
jgi:cholest-4-en-3-one 26-monooxygenase